MTISWVRKADGGVTAFELAKLAGGIRAACQQAGDSNPAQHAEELALCVQHFLEEAFETEIPTTTEISETVVKVLREIGQGPAAAAYDEFRSQREQARRRLRVIDAAACTWGTLPASAPPMRQRIRVVDATARDIGTPGLGFSLPLDGDRTIEVEFLDPYSSGVADEPIGQNWDRKRIIADLTSAGLDSAPARQIAAAVERLLLTSGLRIVATSLIRELVDALLLDGGFDAARQRRRVLGLPVESIERVLGNRPSPDGLERWAGREMLRQFALHEVFSSEIVRLHTDGLLRLYGTACPCHLAASTIDAAGIATPRHDEDAFLREFETELNRLGQSVARAIAVDSLDSVLALVAGSGVDAIRLADRSFDVLRRFTHSHQAFLIVNVDGRVPAATAERLSDGPLFAVQATASQNELAGRVAFALAERILGDTAVSDRCRIDFHPDLQQPPKQLRLELERWARLARNHSRLCLAFDRDTVELCEGLSRQPTGHSSIGQFIGINLPLLLDRIGQPDEGSLLYQVSQLCRSAVRAGVQKRDFLRRQQSQPLGAAVSSQAALAVVPIGLDAFVLRWIGKSIADDEAGLSFARQVLTHLQSQLNREAKPLHLPVRLCGLPAPPSQAIGAAETIAGITCDGGEAPPRQQLAAAGRLHSAVGAGTALLAAPNNLDCEAITELLDFAAREIELRRLVITRPAPPQQSTFADDWDRHE